MYFLIRLTHFRFGIPCTLSSINGFYALFIPVAKLTAFQTEVYYSQSVQHGSFSAQGMRVRAETVEASGT